MTFWDKFYGKMLFPLFLFLLITLSFALQEFFRRSAFIRQYCGQKLAKDSSVSLSYRLISLFQFIIITLYTFIVSSVFQPFNCLKQPDNSYSMAKSPSSLCYDSTWNKNLPALVFFILMYVIGFPAALLYIFVKNYKMIDTVEFKTRYGNLVSPYSRQFFYWELVVMLKRSAFMVSNDFLSTGADYGTRFVFSIALLCVFLWFDATFCPFRIKEKNFIKTS
jgi:hypothetical protein